MQLVRFDKTGGDELKLQISSTVITNVGKVRENNEDNFYYLGEYLKNAEQTSSISDISNRSEYLFAVCDGMGGEDFGEVASKIAVETLKNYDMQGNFYKSTSIYIKEANTKICNEISKNNNKRIGTTLALLHIKENTVSVCNVGDSRVYLLRDNNLIQISKDHTVVQAQVDMGAITKEQTQNHKDKHKLTQHLGIFPAEMVIEPYYSKQISLKQNDVFMLCSDGLTDCVDDKNIQKILLDTDNTKIATNELVRLALENGGKDNITVIVIRNQTKDKGLWNKIWE